MGSASGLSVFMLSCNEAPQRTLLAVYKRSNDLLCHGSTTESSIAEQCAFLIGWLHHPILHPNFQQKMFYVVWSKYTFNSIFFSVWRPGIQCKLFFSSSVLIIYGEKWMRGKVRECGNDSKGWTAKIDFPKQTNCLIYNSDISPVTQRRVWSAPNHRKWQSGLCWYNKQVQITLMNIRERGGAGSRGWGVRD